MKDNYHKIYVMTVLLVALLFVACTKEEKLQADYEAPSELPSELITGTPLGDSIAAFYERYGIIVYTDPTSRRFSADLVSKESLPLIDPRQPADTLAALFALEMIRKELYEVLPSSTKKYVPRNFYFLKTKLIHGNAYTKYYPHAYIWENSIGDVTLGGLNNTAVDPVFLKGALFYALAGALRQIPEYTAFYSNFISAKTDAAVYYWQVTNLQKAYELGFVSANQSEIISNDYDFQLMAAWGATEDPAVKASLLASYPLMARKYGFVTEMFRTAGISLDEINSKWQGSALNPKNN